VKVLDVSIKPERDLLIPTPPPAMMMSPLRARIVKAKQKQTNKKLE
jgi:hypothetical protein